MKRNKLLNKKCNKYYSPSSINVGEVAVKMSILTHINMSRKFQKTKSKSEHSGKNYSKGKDNLSLKYMGRNTLGETSSTLISTRPLRMKLMKNRKLNFKRT
jgi:hypothetical protein